MINKKLGPSEQLWRFPLDCERPELRESQATWQDCRSVPPNLKWKFGQHRPLEIMNGLKLFSRIDEVGRYVGKYAVLVVWQWHGKNRQGNLQKRKAKFQVSKTRNSFFAQPSHQCLHEYGLQATYTILLRHRIVPERGRPEECLWGYSSALLLYCRVDTTMSSLMVVPHGGLLACSSQCSGANIPSLEKRHVKKHQTEFFFPKQGLKAHTSLQVGKNEIKIAKKLNVPPATFPSSERYTKQPYPCAKMAETEMWVRFSRSKMGFFGILPCGHLGNTGLLLS